MSENNRLKLCFRYRLRGLVRASLVFLAIFITVDLVLPALFYVFIGRPLNADGSTFQVSFVKGHQASTTFWFSTVIFIFVGACAAFREDFNHLLAMNNTRRNQFLSALPLMLLSSGTFLLIGLAVRLLEHFTEALVNQKDVLLVLSAYFQEFSGASLPTAAANLLLYFGSFLLAYAFGQTAGILSYRFGRIFLIPFWICFGSAFAFVPILYAGNRLFRQFLDWFQGLGRPLPALNLGVHILLLAALLIGLTGLAYRRLPQNVA